MLRAPLHRPAVLLAVGGVLLLSLSTAAADRPRHRPTPVAPTPSSVPSDGSPAPVASLLPVASPALPPAAGCFGLDRPVMDASPAPVTSLGPGSSSAPVTATPEPTPTSAPDSDTTRVKVTPAGIRLDLPADWIGLQGDDLAALEDVPELTQALAALDASSLVFLGVDVLPGDGCVVGGNLSLYDLGAALDPRLLALSVDAIAAGLEALDEVAGEVKVSTADLPIGAVQRLTFHFDATTDGAVTSWWVRADVFTASGRTLMAAYTAPEATADDAKPVFTAIGKSMREL